MIYLMLVLDYWIILFDHFNWQKVASFIRKCVLWENNVKIPKVTSLNVSLNEPCQIQKYSVYGVTKENQWPDICIIILDFTYYVYYV